MMPEDLSGPFYYERTELRNGFLLQVQRAERRATYRGIGGDAVAGRAGCVGLAGRGCLSLGVLGASGGLGDGDQVINLDQDVQVCGYLYFWWMVDELLCMNHLFSFSFSLDRGYLFLFIFNMPCGHVAYLLWVCIFYF